ncbi:MAG: hypothetical protein ABFR82_06410 [Nitrospirota bacterium]
MKKNVVFAAVIIFVVALLYALSLDEYIPIPNDEEHIGLNKEEECTPCHGEDSGTPLSKEHPPKYSCLKCHEKGAEDKK